jgi:hypothetical protein
MQYKRLSQFPYSLLLTFFISVGWFSLLQPWGSFRDPDSFYHAKLTDIILHGTTAVGAKGVTFGNLFFLQNFPWLDLTILNEKFVDQHLLYHLALAPFVALLGMFQGTQFATVVFAALFITIFYYILRALRLQHPALWTFLIAASMPLSFRLSLGKATPFALTFFLLGLFPLLRGRSSSHLLPPTSSLIFSFFSGLGFALSHGGWIILLVSQVILITASFFYRRVMQWVTHNMDPKSSSLASDLIALTCTVFGILAGLLLHPNRANLFAFLKVQVFQVAIATPTSIQLGLEWLPTPPIQLIANLGPLLMMGCVVALGCLFALKHSWKKIQLEMPFALAVLTTALTLFTLKSSRMVEYLVPILALLLAAVWTLVDVSKLPRALKDLVSEQYLTKWKKPIPFWLPSLLAGLLISIFLIIIGRDIRGTFLALRLGRSFDRLAPVADALRQNATPGERIFQDRWDSFGEVFALAPQFRYVSGVDPTFLLAANPDLARDYENARTNPETPMPKLLQTKWLLIERAPNCREKNQQIRIKTKTSLLCEGTYPP